MFCLLNENTNSLTLTSRSHFTNKQNMKEVITKGLHIIRCNKTLTKNFDPVSMDMTKNDVGTKKLEKQKL